MITVRRPTPNDGDAIARLFMAKYRFSSLEEAKDAFEGECRHQHMRIALDDERVIGIISWRPQGAAHHGVAEVTRLAVLRNYPDPVGIKEQLFDAALAEADWYFHQRNSRLHKVFSLIHADNQHLKHFFATKGMEQEAVLRNHFRFGMDELVYSMFVA
ncbi:MAG: GNAT family N-acetyltransferase [Patescibacteria group bacterium]